MQMISTGQHAVGVIAFGQVATGVIAVGQIATGVIAIGQVSRGVVAIGMVSIGVVGIGMATVGLAWAGGMAGLGGRAGFGIILPLVPLLPRRPRLPKPVALQALTRTGAHGWVPVRLVRARDGLQILYRGSPLALPAPGGGPPQLVRLHPSLAKAAAKFAETSRGSAMARIEVEPDGVKCRRLVEAPPSSLGLWMFVALGQLALLTIAAIALWELALVPVGDALSAAAAN